MLLAVAQVTPSVQGGVGDQQQAPRAPHAVPCPPPVRPARPGPPLPAPPAARGVGPGRRRSRSPGPAMLDFAIFAVTFLLILVGAVLYLYPVMPPVAGRGGSAHGPRRRRAGSERPRGPAAASPRPGPAPAPRHVLCGGVPGGCPRGPGPAGEAAGAGGSAGCAGPSRSPLPPSGAAVPAGFGTPLAHLVFYIPRGIPLRKAVSAHPAALQACRSPGHNLRVRSILQTRPFKSLCRDLSSNRVNNPGLARGTGHTQLIGFVSLSRFEA